MIQKMICSILLLIMTSCVCGVAEPHNTALNYQAEKNNTVTEEWHFLPKADISIPSLKIHCEYVPPKLKVFCTEGQYLGQFARRVQCDKDALSTGHVRLHLSIVGTDNSGWCLCTMTNGFGKMVKEFPLNIDVDEPELHRWETFGLCIAPFLIFLALALFSNGCRSTSNAALHPPEVKEV